MSQKELAAQLGVKEQQLQRYEASGYTGASWTRLCEIIRTMGRERAVPASGQVIAGPMTHKARRAVLL